MIKYRNIQLNFQLFSLVVFAVKIHRYFLVRYLFCATTTGADRNRPSVARSCCTACKNRTTINVLIVTIRKRLNVAIITIYMIWRANVLTARHGTNRPGYVMHYTFLRGSFGPPYVRPSEPVHFLRLVSWTFW